MVNKGETTLPLMVKDLEFSPLPTLRGKRRIEVTGGGRYWMWREGSGPKRKSTYGGKYSLLPEERKAAYERNKERYHNAREKTAH